MDIIPESAFAEKDAAGIFENVRTNRVAVVVKGGEPECVLLSPEEYVRMTDEIKNSFLLATAAEKFISRNPEKMISDEKLKETLGIENLEFE